MVDIAKGFDTPDVGPALEIMRKETLRRSNLEQQDFLNQLRLRRAGRADRAETRAESAESRAQSAEARAVKGFQTRNQLNILKLKEIETELEDANADRFLRKFATLAPGADSAEKVTVFKKKMMTLAKRLKIDDAADLVDGMTAANRNEVAERARLGLNSLQERKTFAQIDRIEALAAKAEAEAKGVPEQNRLERDKLEAQIELQRIKASAAKAEAAPERKRLERQKLEAEIELRRIKALVAKNEAEGAPEQSRLEREKTEADIALQKAKTETEKQKRDKPPKQGEFERLVDRAATEADPVKKKAIVDRINKMSKSTSGFVIDVDRETGDITVSQGAATGQAAIPKRLQITGNQADKLRGSTQMLQSAEGRISDMLEQIEANPAIVGSRGTIRSFVEKNLGAAIDIAELGLPKFLTDRMKAAKEISGRAVGLGEGPSPGEISSLEDFLATALAKARTPGQDRILSNVLKDAKDDVNLTGATSSDDVTNRLRAILGEIRDAKAIFQNRLEAGVTGKSGSLTAEQEAAKEELERRGAR